MTPHFIDFAPQFTKSEAVKMGKEIYGLDVYASPLPSERDQNFLLEVKDTGYKYVLKISNQKEKKEILDLQNSAMERIDSFWQGSICPQICLTKDEKKTAKVAHHRGSSHYVRLVTYIKGLPLGDVDPQPPELLHSVGRLIARVDKALEDFQHPAAHRVFYWDLKTGPDTIKQYLKYIYDPGERSLIHYFLNRFESQALGVVSQLKKTVIHNDANDYNILVESNDKKKFYQGKASGIIDFGDMIHSYTVGDVAVAAAYVMLGKKDFWVSASHLIRGYREIMKISDKELKIIPHLIYMRLCMSVSISAFQKRQNPENKYLHISEKKAWELLKKLKETEKDAADFI